MESMDHMELTVENNKNRDLELIAADNRDQH